MTSLLDFGTMQGILAGILFFLGAVVIWFMPKRTQWYLAAILLLLITPLAIGGFWFSDNQWGISDWDYYFSLHTSYRTTILEHHQFPLWNPWICGGTAALADPEFSVLTPTFLLELLFGIPNGVRLAIFLATGIGAVGMLMLAKRIGLPVFAALLAAIGFSFSSVNLLEVVEGHVNIFSAMWIPWIWWTWLGAYRKHIHPVWCGIFLALTFYQGGIYLLSYTALGFVFITLLVSKPWQALRVTFFAGLWALGLAAFKLIPVIFWLQQFQDAIYAGSNYTLPYLHKILFERHFHGEENVIPNQDSGWHEYGAYVGIALGTLALLGVVTHWKQRIVKGLVVALLVTILISSAGPILKPFFDVVDFIPRSNISRIIMFSVICLSLLAGYGLRYLQTVLGRASITVCVFLGIVAIELMSFSYPLSEQAFVIPPVVPAPSPAPKPIAFSAFNYKTRHKGVDYTRAYAATLAGYGSLNYCSVLSPTSAVRTIHDEGDNTIVSVTGTIDHVNWSPNTVRVVGNATQSDQIMLNSNYAHGWYSPGHTVINRENRLAIPVSEGDFDVTFTYWPRGLYLGSIITFATLIGAVYLVIRYQKRYA